MLLCRSRHNFFLGPQLDLEETALTLLLSHDELGDIGFATLDVRVIP